MQAELHAKEDEGGVEYIWGAGGERERGSESPSPASPPQAKARCPTDHTCGAGETIQATYSKGTGRGQGIVRGTGQVQRPLYVCA